MRRLRNLRRSDARPAQEASAADLLGDVGKADSADPLGWAIRGPRAASGTEILRRVRAGHGGLRLAGGDLHGRDGRGAAAAARADGQPLRRRQSHQCRRIDPRQRARVPGELSPVDTGQGSRAGVGDGGAEPHSGPRRHDRRPRRLSEAGDAVPAVRTTLYPRPVHRRRRRRDGRPDRRRGVGAGRADPGPEGCGDGDPVGRLAQHLPLRMAQERL